MKWNQFLGGILIGGAFGLMVGGAIVQLRPDGERVYPVVLSMTLAIAGVGVSGLRGWASGRVPQDPSHKSPTEPS